MITDRPPTTCAWCGHLAAPEASSETLCGLTCHDQACPESNRGDCLREHAGRAGAEPALPENEGCPTYLISMKTR